MPKDYFRVIGIDPGLETTGVSILDVKGNSYRPVLCECILTKRDHPIAERLKNIYSSLDNMIKEFQPDCVAIEELFFSANVKTALAVGAARGVAVLSGSNNGLGVFEYTPLQVKQAVVGYGRASKQQIKYMLKVILGIKEDFFPSRDDAWDALAIAFCHASMFKFNDKVSSINK